MSMSVGIGGGNWNFSKQIMQVSFEKLELLMVIVMAIGVVGGVDLVFSCASNWSNSVSDSTP